MRWKCTNLSKISQHRYVTILKIIMCKMNKTQQNMQGNITGEYIMWDRVLTVKYK